MITFINFHCDFRRKIFEDKFLRTFFHNISFYFSDHILSFTNILHIIYYQIVVIL